MHSGKKTKYKITYQLKGGKNSKKNPTSYYYTSKTITLKNPTRKGYVFKGWYADKKYKKKVTSIKKGGTGNIVLYAKWKKK
ncbi:MAG: InlB B-repeat-containing protein [Eubacterium sp.]